MDNSRNESGVDVAIRFALCCVKCDAEYAYGGPQWIAGAPLPEKVFRARFRAPEGWVIYQGRPYCAQHPEILPLVAEVASG